MGTPWKVAVVLSLISATLANRIPPTMVAVTLDDDITTTEDPALTTEAPNIPINMTEMLVHSEISMRYAHTTMTTTIENPGGTAQQHNFRVLLPDSAFISSFTMVLNTKAYEAFVMGKEEAEEKYNDARDKGKAAAHVKARNSNHFQVYVNIEPHTTAVYLLKYEELLTRRNGVYNHVLNLHPGGRVPTLRVTVHIKETQHITQLRVPELRTGNQVDASEDDPANPMANIEYFDNNEARITFTPGILEQERLVRLYNKKIIEAGQGRMKGILGQFVVQYDVKRPRTGEILIKDGYFVHFFAPPNLTPLSKHVVFVLDTSGSMGWDLKLSQMIEAMLTILDEVDEQDYFQIVEFNSYVTVRSVAGSGSQAVRATRDNIAAAKNIIRSFKDTTATNIYGALDQALDLVQAGVNGVTTGTQQPEPIVIFLTDGDPTVGITDCKTIIEDITRKNSGSNRAAIFSIAFGDDADRKFLSALSRRNNGFLRYIYPEADAALQISNFYKEVSSPLLSHVKFVYPSDQVIASSLTKLEFPGLYAGSELTVSGQMQPGVTSVNGQIQVATGNQQMSSHVKKLSRRDQSLQRLWVHLTIKQLLEQKNDDENGEEAVRKAKELAVKYSLVTPETSIVVVKPDGAVAVNVEPATSTGPVCDSDCSIEEDDTTDIVDSSTSQYEVVTVLSDPIERYNLMSFPWIEDMVDDASGTIKIGNTVLKLTTGYPIERPRGDKPCGSQKRGRCVYITRCTVGSEISMEWYTSIHCNVQGYAGICCPKADIVPRQTLTPRLSSSVV